MIKKALLAATVAGGLLVPQVAAGVYLPPTPQFVASKPSIIKSENIEFSKHMLLGMPFTMGMLPGKAVAQAFPVIQTTNSGVSTSSATSHTINLPSGIASGDILLLSVIWRVHTANFSSFSQTWTSLREAGVPATPTNRHGLFWRVATGSEGASTTMTFSASTDSVVYVVYRISGGQSAALSTITRTTSSTSVDPPSFSPSWGSAKTLWIAAGVRINHLRTISSYPSSYSLSQVSSFGSGGGSDQGAAAMAAREVEAASEDPGAYTLSGVTAADAFTIAIRPS